MNARAALHLIVVVFYGSLSHAQEVSAQQFLALTQTALSPIHDVRFRFEGEDVFVGPGNLQVPQALAHVEFQGLYAYRSDGATFLEFFHDPGDNQPSRHSVHSLLMGDAEEIVVTPDLGARRNPPIYRSPGGPGRLHVRNSPAFFVFLWCFQRLSSVDEFGYKCLGWETVDGHRCLKIEFDPHPRTQVKRRPVQTFWIDMSRGCHPLKLERKLDGKLIMTTHKIELGRFPLPSGYDVWLPIRGETLRYDHKGKYYDTPVFKELNYIVNGTLKFNQNLSDSNFRIDVKQLSIAARQSARLDAESSRSKAGARMGEPLGLKQRLDEQLTTAEFQARVLDASASAREERGWESLLPIGFALLGAVILATALIWMLRRR